MNNPLEKVSNTLTLSSPAKVNLFLETHYPREDGYWEIETILQEIGLNDEITLILQKKDITLTCNLPSLSTQENLAYKAASLLKEKFKIKEGVSIHIKKNIPIGAGLGGGSSNAATVLKGLNQLWNLSLEKEDLMEIASSLGSDVPFFIVGGTALGKGRGEVITSLPSLPEWEITLVIFPFSIFTASIYSKVHPGNHPQTSLPLIEAIHRKSKEEIEELLFNRLEKIVIKEYPIIGEVKETLFSLGIKGTLMSGSGPTLYAFLPTPEIKKDIQKALSRFGVKLLFTHFQMSKS